MTASRHIDQSRVLNNLARNMADQIADLQVRLAQHQALNEQLLEEERQSAVGDAAASGDVEK